MQNTSSNQSLRERLGSDHVMFVLGILIVTLAIVVFNVFFPDIASSKYVYEDSETIDVLYEAPLTWAIYVVCIVYMIVLYVTRLITNKLAYRSLSRRFDDEAEVNRRYAKADRSSMYALDVFAVISFFVAHLFAAGMEDIMIIIYGPIYMFLLTVGLSILALRIDKMCKLSGKFSGKWKSIGSFFINWLIAILFTCVLLVIVDLAVWAILFVLIDLCLLITVIILMKKAKDTSEAVVVIDTKQRGV